MMCFFCSKEIDDSSEKFMLGLDKPYVNLWFHRDCWRKIKNNFEDYFSQFSVEDVIIKLEKMKNNTENSGKNNVKRGN